MFGKKTKDKEKERVTVIDSLVGQASEIQGNLVFKGGLHVDGKVVGDITAEGDENAVLVLSEIGCIKGEIRVPNVVLNGEVHGDVYSSHHVELAPKAQIHGNVYYNLIEMEMGAEVNGSLVHNTSDTPTQAVSNTPKMPKKEPAAKKEVVPAVDSAAEPDFNLNTANASTPADDKPAMNA